MFESLNKQQFFLDVWQKREQKGSLSREELEILDAMEMHPEFVEYWEMDDIFETLNKGENQVNPFFHITLHNIIKKQIDDNNPAMVGKAYRHLVEKKKADPHEALHSLMIILADEIFNILKHKKAFNQEKYEKRMEKFIS